MARYDADEVEPYVIIEERSSDVGAFLLGAAVGAGLALLLAPRSGTETRHAIGRRVREAQDAARSAAGGVADRVTDTFADARDELERRIESARAAVTARTRQLADAVNIGRAAARDARTDIRSRLDAPAPPVAPASPSASPPSIPPSPAPPSSAPRPATTPTPDAAGERRRGGAAAAPGEG